MRASTLLLPIAIAVALPFVSGRAGSGVNQFALQALESNTPPGTPKAVADMTLAARAFLASLDDDQRALTVMKLEDTERQNWHFTPVTRKGISLQQLRPEQDHLAYALLNSVMSNEGFTKAAAIMSLEQILHERENKSPVRNPEKYHILIFGDPSETGSWAWRFEGHHFACNVTIAGGKAVSVAPSFMGSNPGEVREGPRKGLRVLGEEEDIARKLAKTLTDEQKKDAILPGKVPADILTGESRKASPLSPAGIASSKLDDSQRQLLWNVIEEYIGRFRPDLAIPVSAKITESGWEKLTFAWAGELEPEQGTYYRIQSPDFLFEYDNTQNSGNHPHAVWRDFANDFGEDMLKQHYQAEHAK